MDEATSRNATGAPLFLFYTPHTWQPHPPKRKYIHTHTPTYSGIVAVSSANVDLANAESLKPAWSVNPKGWRPTIGTLTKLDLMDAGTRALDMLTGYVYPLK